MARSLRFSFAARILAAVTISLSGLFVDGASAQSPVQTPEYVPGEIIVKLKGSSKTMKAQAFIGKAVSEQSMSLKGSWSGLNMHHFKLNNDAEMEARLNQLKNDPDVEYAEPNYILRLAPTDSSQPGAMSIEEARSVAAHSTVGAMAQTSAPIQLANAWLAESSGSVGNCHADLCRRGNH